MRDGREVMSPGQDVGVPEENRSSNNCGTPAKPDRYWDLFLDSARGPKAIGT
jgi:hypothetical protein